MGNPESREGAQPIQDRIYRILRINKMGGNRLRNLHEMRVARVGLQTPLKQGRLPTAQSKRAKSAPLAFISACPMVTLEETAEPWGSKSAIHRNCAHLASYAPFKCKNHIVRFPVPGQPNPVNPYNPVNPVLHWCSTTALLIPTHASPDGSIVGGCNKSGPARANNGWATIKGVPGCPAGRFMPLSPSHFRFQIASHAALRHCCGLS